MRKPGSSIQNRKPREPISEEWKRYIVWWSEQKGKSLRAAAKRFGVPRSSISDWKRAILRGKNLYTPGRPRALDNEALAQVEKEAMHAYLHNNTTPAGKFGIDG